VQDFRDWKYSSYGIVFAEKKTIIKRDQVVNWFGTKEEYLSLHKQWVTDAQAKWFTDDDFD
jgi:putative transposase